MSEEHHSGSKPRPRIQTLSDLIFGLALSIGALMLIGQQPTDFQEILTSLLFYSFSFLVLVSVWRSYSTILSVLPVETERLITINILLLFTVSIEPYLFNQLFIDNGKLWSEVSMLYAIDIAVMFLVLTFFNHSLSKKENHLTAKEHQKKYRSDRNYGLIIAAVFTISILPIFELNIQIAGLTFPLRVVVWIGALLLGLIKRHILPMRKQD